MGQRSRSRAGWRLPSVIELKSVQDPSLPTPFVPGSVFTGIQSASYWSATTDADNPTIAWVVYFTIGNVTRVFKTDVIHLAWCVRGGMNEYTY